MTLKRAVVLATLVVTSPIWARPDAEHGATRSNARAAAGLPQAAPAAIGEGAAQGLAPRIKFVKQRSADITMPTDATGRLIVKYRDEVKARVADGKSMRSLTNGDLSWSQQALTQMNLSVKPAITLATDKLEQIQSKAAARSKRLQPDLAGFVYVSVPPGSAPGAIVQAAKALNDSPEVEFVDWELTYMPGGGPEPTGACCIPTGVGGTPPLSVQCVGPVTQVICEQQGGAYQNDGTTCAGVVCDPTIGACCISDTECILEDEVDCGILTGDPESFKGVGTNCVLDEEICADPPEPGCGVLETGSCFECHSPLGFGGGLYCNDEICCDAVCAVDPFCCDEDAQSPGRGPPHWDAGCVSLANQFCGGPLQRCESPFSGPCFESHTGPGCDRATCCQSVCNLEPFCCDISWDSLCVETALNNADCFAAPTNVTPSLIAAQGYLKPQSYIAYWGEVPGLIAPGISQNPCLAPDFVPLAGFGGQGWDLEGLWSFGALINALGAPGPNMTRGKTIKVGVIEHTAFVDWQDPSKTHEDLRGKVIPEPNQTLIINPGSESLGGNHGTACLGIIGAKDDGVKGHSESAIRPGGGEIGCCGVAPEAELYFFPIISIEEGGRLLNAIMSAINTFGPGDVLSFSIGPGAPNQTLATSEANWTMLRLAADLGITCCIAAGNACSNIDAQGQFQSQDSDVIIVGACYPGAGPGNVYCRLGFSNFCQSCTGANTVHVSAWGTGVATLGYGNMFAGGGSPYRSYTNTFNGTSAACPQIAALAANLQGLAKQFYGIPLMPSQIRGMVAGGGFRQCGLPAASLPGPDPEFPCAGDYDFDATPARINGNAGEICYPDPVACGEGLVSSAIFDLNPLIDNITIIRGEHQYGNKFSIKANDANYFVLRSLYTERDHQPSISGPAARVTYLGTGQIADLLITAHTEPGTINTMSVLHTVLTPGPLAFMFTEVYDWEQGKWVFIGFAQLPAGEGGVVNSQYNIAFASRYISPRDRQVLIRIYTLAMGNLAPPGTQHPEEANRYDLRIDSVNLLTGGGFGTGNPGQPPTP